MRRRLERRSEIKRCSGRSGAFLVRYRGSFTWVVCAPSHAADFAARPFGICSQHFAMVALRSLSGRAALCPQCIP